MNALLLLPVLCDQSVAGHGSGCPARLCSHRIVLRMRTALLQLVLCAALTTLRSGEACVQVAEVLGAVLPAVPGPSASA